MLCKYSSGGWDVLQVLTDSSSSGLLLYAALVDLLAEDFLSEEANRTLKKKDRVMAFFWVILGGKGSLPLVELCNRN
jgi:hypothetical protein